MNLGVAFGARIVYFAVCLAEGWPSGQWQQTVNLPAYAFEGSNPSPSTISYSQTVSKFGCGKKKRGCSSMVELQPSKLIAWVRFPSPAPFWRC